jgi:hypothetical protein
VQLNLLKIVVENEHFADFFSRFFGDEIPGEVEGSQELISAHHGANLLD